VNEDQCLEDRNEDGFCAKHLHQKNRLYLLYKCTGAIAEGITETAVFRKPSERGLVQAHLYLTVSIEACRILSTHFFGGIGGGHEEYIEKLRQDRALAESSIEEKNFEIQNSVTEVKHATHEMIKKATLELTMDEMSKFIST
jgi:hypothetical protein